MDQDRTVRGVVRPNAGAASEIEEPYDVRVQWAGGELRPGIRRGHVGALGLERTLIAIRQAVSVQAQHLAAVAHNINPVALDRCRGGYPTFGEPL